MLLQLSLVPDVTCSTCPVQLQESGAEIYLTLSQPGISLYHSCELIGQHDPIGATELMKEGVVFFVFSRIFILLSRESDQSAVTRSHRELPAICLPHQDEGIPLSAFPDRTTSKLADLFSTLSL